MAEPQHRKHRSKQDYETPDNFLEAVKDHFDIRNFIIDLAATHKNAKAHDYYTEEMNSLILPWNSFGGWNWCNPPYSNIDPWVHRAYQESREGSYEAKTLMLLPAGVGSNWWKKWVHGKCTVHLLNGRLTFKGATSCYPKDCVLLQYQPGCWCNDYRVWTWPTP